MTDKTSTTFKMKHDWDVRAAEDVIYFTSPKMERMAIEEYFKQGRKQAYDLTFDTFRALSFEPVGKRVLEIGCGIGRLFPGFTEMFSEVWGVDVSEEMIKQGAKLLTSPNIRFILNDGCDLKDVPGDYFDFVFSYNVLQHVPEEWVIHSYLAEVYRVLKPGGAFQLHFRNKPKFKRYVYLHLPPPLRRIAQVLYRLLLLYPLRGLSLQSPQPWRKGRIFGDVKTWLGLGYSPSVLVKKLTELGFLEVKALPDKTYPFKDMKFWVIGRKP